MGKETENTTLQDPEELVDYTAPLTGGNTRDIFASVNGETVQIKRGVPVKLKRKFLEVIQNAEKQEYDAFMNRQAAMDKANKETANL